MADDPQPHPTQAEADDLKLQAHGAAATDLPPVNRDVPMVSGSATVGGTLSCTMGNWEGEPSAYSYAWQGGGGHSLGNADTLVVPEQAVDQDVFCVVTATNAFGSTPAPASNAVTIGPAVTRSAPREPAREPARSEPGPKR